VSDFPPAEDVAIVDLERSAKFMVNHATKESIREIKLVIRDLEELVRKLERKLDGK
jgi:hypothetical protein